MCISVPFSSAIRNRSKLKNKYNESRSDENWLNSEKQKTFKKNRKKKCFNNLNIKNLSDRKKFWKNIKSFF